MNDTITVTLLANAGLLLQFGDCTILLDALQRSEDAPFSPLPRGLWEQILSGTPPFNKINALLFTHLHPDHFCGEMTAAYLKKHEVPLIMMPDDMTAPGAEEAASAAGQRLVRLHGAVPVRAGLPSGVSVLAFPTRHLDKRYREVPHYCYLLSSAAGNVLITADIDYTWETLTEAPVDAAFVNPLFFAALRAGRFFKGQLNAKQLCVYHIPFAGDDKMKMRASAAYNAARWQGQAAVTVFARPLQQIVIGRQLP